MSLLAQAALDLRAILEGEFAVDITVTDPVGRTAVLRGLQTDIAQSIDPETGLAVTGRKASVTLPLAAFAEAGLGLPVNIPDKNRRPWVVAFATPTGPVQTFKVAEAWPDKQGALVCILEVYKP